MEGPLKTDAGPVLHRVPAADHRMAADPLPGAVGDAFRQPGPALPAVPVDHGENVKLSERLGNVEFGI